MTHRNFGLLFTLAAAMLVGACESATAPKSEATLHPVVASRAAGTSIVTVFATGLEYPRGLTFGRDGYLYVAEAGTAGTNSTSPSQCAQVVAPVGPYMSGSTGRISRIDRRGHRTTFASGFPSSINMFGDVLGVNDLAFKGGRLYALLSGGGCSHGSPHVPAGIARVRDSGSWSLIADLSTWQMGHPAAVTNPADFEPDGSWYSLIRAEGSLIAVEPNHGDVVRVDASNGHISRIVDISASQGHIVPTVIAERRGALYLSNLGTFPSIPGAEKIFRISRSGHVTVVAEGFTAVLGLEFDRCGRLYVLESTTAAGFPTPNAGRVLRLDRRGHREVIADGLFLPTGLRFGFDGALYISNKGFGPPQPGEILRVDVRDANDRDPSLDMETGAE